MGYVIETNISYNADGSFCDFQSRVIEVSDWHEEFVYEVRNQISKNRTGTLSGLTLPRETKIHNLKFDDTHLSCDFINPLGVKMKKLAYYTERMI